MDTLTRPPAAGVYSVELSATLKAARESRAFVATVLSAWTVPDDRIDTAKLLTSELATNAITHGQAEGGTFTLEVRSFGCCLGVDVADDSPSLPVLHPVAPDVVHGRGLLLVEQLADSWGYYFDSGRKHVWFHLRLTGLTPPPQAFQVAPAA